MNMNKKNFLDISKSNRAVFRCDFCRDIPAPNAFGAHGQQFVVLIKDGSKKAPTFVSITPKEMSFTRIGQKLKPMQVAVCRTCIEGLTAKALGEVYP